MTDTLPSVLTAWLTAVAGFAMFARARSVRGWAAGHVAYAVALVGMSYLAVTAEPIRQAEATAGEFAPLIAAVGEPTYHATGCPLAKREAVYRSRAEAEWAGKVPCTFCLIQYAQHRPDGEREQHGSANAGQKVDDLPLVHEQPPGE